MGFNELINPVAQTIRDATPTFLGGENEANVNPSTPFYQPDRVEDSSKLFATNNKTFNRKSPEELQQFVGENLKPSNNPEDRHFYILEDEFGNQKIGTAKGNAYERYRNDPAFQSYKVLYDQPIENANEIERMIQGNEGMIQSREYDFGSSRQGPLQSGNTEIYEASTNPLFNSGAVNAVSRMSTPNQQLAVQSMDFADKVFKTEKHKQNAVKSAKAKARTAGYSLFDASTWEKAGKQLVTEFSSLDNLATGAQDLALGTAIGVDKLFGGIAGLVGAEDTRQFFEDRANINYEAQTNQDGTASTIGEILPELALPATTPIKAVSTAGRIAQGAIGGASINAGVEALKAQSDIKVGEDQHIFEAGAIGGVLGGIIGVLTKNKQLGEQIGKEFDTGTTEQKKAILDQYPEARPYLEEYVTRQQQQTKVSSVPVKEVKPEPTVREAERTTKEVTEVEVEKTTKPKVEKEVVKADKPESNVNIETGEVKTKTGEKQKSEALVKQERLARTSESKVVDPREKTGKELPNQIPIKAKDEPFVRKLGWDFRLRNYDENGKAINSQGGTEAKFSQAIQPRRKVTNVDDEVNRLTKMYDNDAKLRNVYDSAQAVLKGAVKGKSKAKQVANRNAFMRDNYLELAHNKSLPKKQRDLAFKRAEELKNKKVVIPKTPKEVKAKVKELYEKQFEGKVFSPHKKVEARERKYQSIANKRKENEIAYRAKKNEEIKEEPLLSVIKDRLAELKPDYINAVKSVEDIANSKGFKYDAESTKGSAFTPHQKVIDEYTNLTTDLALYEQKELSKMDVQDRLRDWLEGKELERSVIKVKDQEGLDKEFARANEIRDKLQIKRIEFKTPKPRKETSGERPDNSTKGLKQARVKHEARVKNIKSGKATLDGFEKKLLDNGAKPEKVAELSQPIATKENELVRRDEVRSELIEEYNNKKRTELGLPTKKAEKPKQRILATDSTADFSNSVGQNMAILMGDLKIAENVKLTGKSDDFRSKIAERINRELGTNYTKSDIKPLFMQQMYGQMEKGLLKQVKGDKALFDGYERAMKEDYPAFYELSDALMKLADNNPKGEFKYNLPDGTEVSFSLKGKDSVKQKTGQTIEFGTGEYDKYSRALAPNIMHSIDGYIIREIGNRLGDMEIDSRAIHDALTFRTEHSDLVFRTALDVQKDLLKSNTLHDIMTQLGYKGEPLKKNTLTEDHLEKSLGKSMDFEHFANKYEEHDTPRDMTNDRLLEEDDLIREYFARNNVKLSGVNQLTDHMVTEAGFNTLKYSNARTTDDVYERAMVEALTGRKQPRIKVPEGKHFDRIQEEIFTEARAKAEKNPMLVGYLEGKRKFFDEKGNSLLSNNKTIQQIETEQMRQYRKQLKGMTTREIKQVTKLVKQKIRVKRLNKETVIAPDFKALSKQVKSWKPAKELTTSEAKAHNLVMKTELGERPRTSDYMTTWNEQLSSSPVYKEFNTLEVMRNVFRSESSRKAEIIANRVKKIPKKQQKDISVLLNSDYEAIRGMTKEKADSIWKNAGSLRRLIWKEINDGARALTSKSEQYGAYLNNATLIAERYNLDKSAIKLIDQLISIKAMKDNNGWEALNRLDNSKDMNYVLDVMANNRMISERSLFQNNPEKMVKGFKSEVYKGNKFIDDDGKVKYDAEQKYEEGVIGSERENKKVGTQFEGDLPEQLLEKRMEDLQGLSQKEMKAVKQIFNITNDRRTKAQSKYIEDLWKKGSKHLGRFKTLDEELKFMQDNRLKKTNGKYRQVAGDKIRYEAGKIDDLSEIIAETVRSTSEKLHEQGIIAKVLDELEGGKSNLFSKEPKANFVEMTKEQKAMIPFHLREDFNYINPQFIDKLLGRKEVRLFANDESSQAVKIADRLLNNLGVMFKQNVVLKNPTSYLNAMLVNQTLGMAQKANPIKYAKYQKEAIRDLKEMKELVRRQTLRTSAGKKPDPRITKKLENNILYKMERAGLSTNKVEGVLGDNDLLGSMLEDKLGKLSVPFKYLNLNQKTIGGKVSLEAFSAIDTMGRYAMTKQLMSKGKSMEEAVREANNLFGNMDKMVPPLIEKLDKYGIVPFAKWFSLTSPQLLKLSKDNPVTALALGISLFILGQETDRNLSSVNPLEAMIDFAEDSAYLGTKEKLEEKGFLDTLQNRAGSNVIPKYMVNAYKHPETLGLEKLMKNRVHYRPFKGFVQDTVEGDEK